jgi:stearoyl-CoA desaturase (Delta-9 desaturase)
MIFETDLRAGKTDVSDFEKDALIMWQHHWYYYLLSFWGYVFPVVVTGLLLGDWKGGFYYTAALRLTVAHHVSNPCPMYKLKCS